MKTFERSKRYMKITICIGSSCHLKGSRQIVEEMQSLVAEKNLKDQIDLAGKFCMGNCQNGVCVTIDDDQFSLRPEETKSFFENEVLTRLQ
ncbi:MAG: (2Fe-2S) ferredoxin domain-containing protein [Clostridiales bacterium]|nr:(2Fe-2S) ferredoxin domain-containing protein [Clostridiales bacterium]